MNILPIISSKNKVRGFALISVIIVMSLLMIIVLGLMSISSINQRTSTLDKDIQIARANARLGLMIAIDQLQKNVGPDQRITALADLKHPNSSNTKWVGVYGNEEVADYTHKPSGIPSQPYKPVLLNWLVSGNDSVAYDFSMSSGNFGQVTSPPSDIPFKPTDNVDLGNLTIASEKAALLVGGGSISASNPDNYVTAPIVAIKDAGKTTGGYAYWTGDEGMKARITLRDNYLQQTTASEIDAAKAYSFITSQRSGIEMMSRDADESSIIGNDFDPSSDDLPKVISTGGIPLLSGSILSDKIHKYRFHDITAYSSSVIADTYAGGLKKDMNAAVYGGHGPGDSNPIFTPESASEFALPTWGHLRSWANFTVPLASPQPNATSVQPYTATQTRFGPVLSLASLGLSVERDPNNATQMRVLLYPAVILWNPYTVGIPAEDYEVGFRFIPSASGNDAITVKQGIEKIDSGGNVSTSWSDAGTFHLSGGDAALNSGSSFFRFKVEGSEIPPGESHIYLSDDAAIGSVYIPGVSKLVRAPDSSPTGYNYRHFASSKSFSISNSDPLIDFSSSYPNKGNMTNGDRREVVLTTPGSLASGFSSSTPIYQALLDMNLYNRIFPSYYGDPRKLSVMGQQVHLVLRSQLIMEARGGFSADWRKVGAMYPNGGARGQERNRWIANHNPVAPFIKRTKLEKDLWRGGAFSHGSIADGDLRNQNRFMVGINNVSNYTAGVGGDQSSGADGTLLDILPPSMLLSLGQLQHAQLNPYVFGTTNSFGNSPANVAIPRNQHYIPDYVARPGNSPTNYEDPLYDYSWHANRALWDSHFLSTVEASVTQSDIDNNKPLPNSRFIYYKPGSSITSVDKLSPSSSDAYDEAAANLMLSGGFNVNSTSVNAWRAILTGTNNLTVPDTLADPIYASTPLNAMMPRFSRDTSDTKDKGPLNMWDTSGNQRYNVYRGNRELLLFQQEGNTSESQSDAQERLHLVAHELAEKIVDEVRLRGPFLSLSDFINRDLTTEDEGIRGALQAALDKMSSNQVNPDSSFGRIGAFVSDYALDNNVSGWDLEHYMGTPLSEKGSSSNSRTAMAPKHLTQADILSTIGPSITARSDTFVIRCYGECVEPSSQRVTAKAWCEAVVQRSPDYVDPADKASASPDALTKDINKRLGRKFNVINFRWLSKEEL